MKNLFCLILVILAGGCTEQPKDEVIIEVSAINILADDIKVTFSDMDHFKIGDLAFAKLNSGGQALLKFKLVEPTMARYEAGRKSGVMFLTPGDHLKLKFTVEGNAVFNGKGKEVNNYLAALTDKTNKLRRRAKTLRKGLPLDEFMMNYDSLENAILSFHKTYVDSTKLTDEAETLLKKRNDIILKMVKQDYTNFVFENDFILKRKKITEKEKTGPFRIPEELKITVPIDTALLQYHVSEYGLLLRGYIKSNFYNAIIDTRITEFDRIKFQLPSMVDKEIRQTAYPGRLKLYLISENIFTSILERGITPSVDSIFTNFKITNPTAPALPLLQKVYDKELITNPRK